ncbi:MAG: multidrug effflux MFS transporter [Pseudomonadota bacterium]
MAYSTFRMAATLGLLTVVGPFAVDMYLPALPAIARDFDTSVAATQATLTTYLLGFGIAQLVYGPWSDQVGRRVPLYAGLGVFVLGSLGCATAQSVEWMLAGRFVQGVGGAAVMVIPRAIIRDMHTGTAATRLTALVMLVVSVSPMLAPLIGSLLMLAGSWRSIFALISVYAVLGLFLARFALAETLTPARRIPVNTTNMVAGIRVLLSSRSFVTLTFVSGFGMASFLVFIAGGSFVYTQEFGLSPMQFSLAFACNAVGFFAASQIAAPLGTRYGMQSVVRLATAGFALSAVALLILALVGAVTLWVLVGMLVVTNAFLGLMIPTTIVMALDEHGDIAGLASSLGGTLQMAAGAGMITVFGPFFDGTATPMIAAIALCATTAFVMSQLAPKRTVAASSG